MFKETCTKNRRNYAIMTAFDLFDLAFPLLYEKYFLEISKILENLSLQKLWKIFSLNKMLN